MAVKPEFGTNYWGSGPVIFKHVRDHGDQSLIGDLDSCPNLVALWCNCSLQNNRFNPAPLLVSTSPIILILPSTKNIIK